MKKKHPEHVNLERWLVSYADFITLLFAFFVIMYALAQADKAKFAAAAASIRAAFGAGPVGMIDLGGASGGHTANPFETIEAAGGRVHNLPAGKTNTAAEPDTELLEVKELLEETVSLELGSSDYADALEMQYDSRGLIVRVAVKDFFEEGAVEASEDLRPLLDRIARVLAKTKRLIRIEGHADIAESHPVDFPSAWELSTARAAWLARYWIKRFDLDPGRIGVAGYSYHRPLVKHSKKSINEKAPWDRGKNRRVEIIILNNLYEN